MTLYEYASSILAEHPFALQPSVTVTDLRCFVEKRLSSAYTTATL